MGASRDVRPDPSRISDISGFVEQFGRLRVWAGNPSLRTLAKLAGPLLRPPRALGHTTVAEVFQPGRRRLDLDLVVAIARALGLAEDEIDLWRQAWFRVHAARTAHGSAGVLRQLPADLATFTGRAEAVHRLMRAVESNARPRAIVISAIEGMAGVGKTRLAVHVAHELLRAGRFADVQLYVDLCGFDPDRPPADPSAVLDSFLRQLGEAPQNIPETLDERAAMFRDRMHGKDALVLLDNAADEAQVRDLIPGDPRCLVLITSRRSLSGLDGADPHALDVFTPEEGLGLLEALVGADRVAAEPQGAADLVAAAGYLPLAVALLGARLRSRPTWTFAELNKRLGDDLTALTTGGRSFAAAVDLSYQGLPDDVRRVFLLLGLYPGVDFPLHAVAALADLSLSAARDAVDRLVDEHVAQERGAGRYGFHDLIRRFAADRANAELERAERDLAMTRLLRWFVATAGIAAKAIGQARPADVPEPAPAGAYLGFAEISDAMEWFEHERHAMLGAVRYATAAQIPDLAWRIPANMFEFFHARLYLDDWLETIEAAAPDVRYATEPRAAALMANQRSCVHIAAHRLPEAFEWSERAKAAFEAIDDHRGLIGVLNNQAMMLQSLDKFDEGREAYEKALAACEQFGYPELRAIILNNVGALEMDRDRPHDALPWLNQAEDAAQGLDITFTRGKILANLTTVNREIGRLDEAMTQAVLALEILRETGNELDEARVLEDVGVVMDLRGDRETALAHWERAHSILAEHGDPRAADVAERLAKA